MCSEVVVDLAISEMEEEASHGERAHTWCVTEIK